MSVSTLNKKSVNDHFRPIFTNASVGILVINGDGKVIAINPFALKEFGYAEKEIVGQKIEALIPEGILKKPCRHIRAGSPVLYDIHRVAAKKNGQRFPVEISLSCYRDHNDERIIAVVHPVSNKRKSKAAIEILHKELEATVRQRTRELNETLHHLEVINEKLEAAIHFQKAVLDNAGAMIVITDEKGTIKLFNPEAALNTGYSEQEIVNKKTVLLFHDKNDIARRKKELLRKHGTTTENDFDMLVENARRNIHDETQYIFRRKNGTSFPVSLTVTAIRDTEGKITGFLGIAIDISERKKAEEDLRAALEKEKGLNELKSRFVTMASHEFRTPLSTVLSSAYLIEKYALTDEQPKREKHVQRIVSSVNMLTDILNDFLSVGKIEEGRIQVRPAPFAVSDLVLSVTSEMRDTLKAGQQIRYSHEGRREVTTDPSLLKHIIMNLISNASKFSHEASPIEIKTVNQNQHFILSVKDYGIGISKEDQQHLMERFFRGANAGTIQGTGLGLHIVSRYAELMNGTVSYESEAGKGTEFKITFQTKTGEYEKDTADRR